MCLLELWFSQVESESEVAQPCLTLWTVAHQASPSMGFSRQEYWSGLPFPSPGDLPDPGIEPVSPAVQADDMPSNGVAGSYGNFIPSFLRNLHSVLCNGCINLHSHQLCRKVPSSPHPLQHLVCRFFDDDSSDWCEVNPHCINSFDFHFSNNQ